MLIATDNPAGSGELFKTVGVADAGSSLLHLLKHVSAGFGRIEIVGPRQDCVCVLLSKTELDSLERALEILSGTTDARQMHQQIREIVAAAQAG